MNKISAIVIAKNEEDMIKGSLESLSFCDEILVIDNGSRDETKTIAENMGAKVYEIETDNFSEIRNYGLKNAQNEWVLYLDADERVDKDLQEEIKKSLSSKEFSAYSLKRKNFYLGNNEWPYVEKIIRLFNKNGLSGWKGEIHESPILTGSVGQLQGFINHYTHRDLSSMVAKTMEWSTIEASIRYKQNHPPMSWWRFPRVMLTAFVNSYVFQQGFKAKAVGVIEAVFQAFSIFVTYAKLWEMQNQDKFSKHTKNV